MQLRSRNRLLPMTKSKLPYGCITITTYDEFRAQIQAFADNHYPFLIIIGRGGIGKTETTKEVLKDYLHITGAPSAWNLYRDIHDAAPDYILLDDCATKFYKDSTIQGFLKNLTETRPVKTLMWRTD